MTDTTTPSATNPAPASAPVATPDAPAITQAAPVVPQETAPTPVTTDVSPTTSPTPAEAASPEAATAQAPVEAAKPTTVLGAEPAKPVDPKAGEAAKSAETPKTDASAEAAKPAEQPKEGDGQTAEPAPAPTYEAFKLPEGVTADEKVLGEFTSLLAQVELAKGDHAKMQETGQKLMDQHVAVLQENLKRQSEYFVGLFEKQKTDWREAFMKDPEIGGNRWETTAKAANEFISTHGGNEAQQKELRQLMESTGVGNHPAMIRIFAKAMVNMAEGSPLPASRPENSRPASKIERRYGKMN